MKAKGILIRSAVLLGALLLQFGIMQRLTVFSFAANLCVPALVGVCCFSSPAASAVFGAAYGLAIDGAVGRSFGVNTLLYMYLAVSVKLLANEKINNSPAIMAAYVWLFSAAYYLAYGLLSLTVVRGDISVGRWLLTAAVTSTLNSILSLPAFWLTDRLRRRGGAA